MSRVIRVAVGILITLPVLAHLGYAAWVSPFTKYYLTVDEFMASPDLVQEPARVAGLIAPGSISVERESFTVRFQIRGESSTLPVAYNGVLPDTFRPGLTAIVEGRIEDGIFLADTVMVKCPHEFLAVS